jgi:S-adenosylmethionine decarboxylase
MSGGTEWLVDAFGCDPVRLASPAALLVLSEGVIARLGLHVLGTPVVHQFPPPGGVTGLYLLSESHWAWHTYPESELATFNLYCCRVRPPLDWSAVLGAALGARSVEVKSVARGLGSVHASSPPESARTWVHLPGTGQ